MTRRSATLLLALGLGTAPLACDQHRQATQPPDVAVRELPIPDPFPDEATLLEIASRPHPQPTLLFGRGIANVDTWTMRQPGATRYEVHGYEGDDRNAKVAAALLADDPTGRRLTEGMQCFASEYGRFVLAHGAEPAADIEAFMAGRCGTLVARPAVVATLSPINAAAKAPLSAERDGPLLQASFGDTAPGSHVGVWKGNNRTQGITVLAAGVIDAPLDEPLLVSHAGADHVDLRGHVAWEYDTLVGYATAGAHGVTECTSIDGVVNASPTFAMRCAIDAADPLTMIELHATARGDVLDQRVFRALVSSQATAADTYRAPALPLPSSPGVPEEASVVNAVNTLRLANKLTTVAPASSQSKVLGALLRQYLGATKDVGGSAAAQIELAMIAGREVEGDISRGSLMLTDAAIPRSLEREIAAGLGSPYQRAQLLDPTATAVAFAALQDESFGMRRSVLATYCAAPPEPGPGEPAAAGPAPEAVSFLDALDQRRAAAGLPPVTRSTQPQDQQRVDQATARVRAGTHSPAQALDELLGAFVTATGRSFKGRMLFPYSLHGWSPVFEGDLLTAPEVLVIVGTDHFRPEGAAWVRPMVVVVFSTP